MGLILTHPRADKAWAEDRVRESENRVGELLRLDSHGSLLWEELERLRGARTHLELVDLRSTPLLDEDDLALPGDGLDRLDLDGEP